MMSRTPTRPPSHPAIHPTSHPSCGSPLYPRVASVLLNGERSQAPAKFGQRPRTSLCARRQKRWSERRRRKIAVDSPDGDSLAFSLYVGCDVCVHECESSAIHHPICLQRQCSALSRTKNWLRAPLIGLNVAAILSYSSVREGASQAWSIGLASALKPMWISSHNVGAIGPSGGNL